ncbi:MAG: glycogen debranching protein [Acidobacteriaceae bacterium]|nr:glycogen debranching protein [Acidobacteriaceae bacterium]
MPIRGFLVVLLAANSLAIHPLANQAAAAELAPLPAFPKHESTLRIVSRCVPLTPWTVAGEHGALFGRQNGVFEAWLWPNKILSNFRIGAELADYPVPIDVNALAAEIEVTPAETTITYSHAAFTIRQHMFAPRGPERPSTGAAVYFEIESARPLELTFSFTPEMLHMWPAPNFGRPNGEWISSGGFYILHTDDPKFSAIVAMPRTRPGIMAPYQEHPQTYPLELKLSYDPHRDRGSVYPLIFGLADPASAADRVSQIASSLLNLYAQTQDYYAHFFDRRLTIDTPDRRLNEALRWAEVSIDQMQVQYHDETGMVAGYYESADSARPGYAWFFGRDTLFTTYAINSYGDFALTRRALDFLIRRQREDGKIMHEYSQSADALDWKSTPYFYAAADSTPLFVMAMCDYVKASGDKEYLMNNWDAVRRAYQFTRAHETTDGIYSNTQGTGWVESWPTGMPHEEIYLAALDQQSAQAVSYLASLVGDQQLAGAAEKKAREIAEKIESEYYEPSEDFYAFSRNPDGSLDRTASIYPSVAWWDGTFGLKSPGPMLARWASNEFSTDWGTRDISERTSFYDPISYHQGSIWPLFTGWVSLAEYRAGRPLSGYAHLMQNAGLTWAQDLGSVTELLSGEFFQPLGRSSSHQMWSSAMVIVPLIRGLFGVTWDAPNQKLHLEPHLPADWDRATLHNVPLGGRTVDLEYRRAAGHLIVSGGATLDIPLPAVELAIPAHLPLEGALTSQLKVLDQRQTPSQAIFSLASIGGATYDLPLRLNRPNVTAQGGEVRGSLLHVEFPNGSGYQTKTITFTW